MRRSVAGLAAVLVLLTACTGGGDQPSAPGDPASTAPTTTAPQDAAPVVVEATYLSVPVELEVAPVQVQGDVALLSVEYRLGAGAPAGAAFSAGQVLKTATGAVGPTGVRLVDLEAGQVHPPGTDAQRQPAVTREALPVTAQAPATSHGLYRAPAADTVAVLFPYLGLVRDVPVVRLGAGEELPVTAEDLGRAGEITYAAAPVDQFTVAFDDSSSTRVSHEDVTVALASDVLFGVDLADLSPEAQAVVDRAASEIAAKAAEGRVEVVGHTDDVASPEHNQDLSVRRAQAVVDRLAPVLGTGFEVVAEGRGESEPAVAGTSPEARTANRRVELQFTAATPGASVDVGSDAAVPEPTGPVASGGAAVEVAGVTGFAVRALAVEPVGPFLVGTLEVERTGAGTAQPTGLFGDFVQGLATGRGLSALAMGGGAHNATLLGDASRVYPLDYVRPAAESVTSDVRAVVADEWVVAPMAPGETVTTTVLWPDPGGDTVTVDVPERFRLAGVPVSRP